MSEKQKIDEGLSFNKSKIKVTLNGTMALYLKNNLNYL
jgi:hypothetical protein